jgi:hypothetical protein
MKRSDETGLSDSTTALVDSSQWRSCLKFGTSCLTSNDGLCDVRLETRDVFDLKRSDANRGRLACLLAYSVQPGGRD